VRTFREYFQSSRYPVAVRVNAGKTRAAWMWAFGSACILGLAGWMGTLAQARAEPAPNPWALIRAPARGPASAIGDYSTGCLQGAAPLPLQGDGYRVMHPSRLRYFGHPELVQFIQTLGRAVKLQGLEPVLVGDLSQPRGGPAPKGHSSHQTGLDVDLWFWHPSRPVRANQVEELKARSILDGKAGTIRAEAAARVTELLRLTSRDPRVTRIFVHPIIKRQLCGDVGGAREWLQKVRPWYGHDDHFHVRLSCPSDSADCVDQQPIAAGDGCDDLAWWFSPEAQADREKGRQKYQSKVGRAPGMPTQCYSLLR
jgi:penicillin-insensitive murein endopeptidase